MDWDIQKQPDSSVNARLSGCFYLYRLKIAEADPDC